MLRAIIVDDEKKHRMALAMLIDKHFKELSVLTTCGTLGEAKKAIDKYSPEIIFLNAEMRDSHGLDLLMQVKGNSIEIVFTIDAAHPFIHDSRFATLEFVVKPVDRLSLYNSVQRAKRKLLKVQERMKLDVLLENINYMNVTKKIALPTRNGMDFVAINEIIRCESDNNYTIFHMLGKSKIVIGKTLGEYESMFSAHHFFRVHQSHLINLRYVKNYTKGSTGRLIMEDNSVVDVSRRKRDEFLRQLALIT